jgi:iron complex transport system substrate-binding protein
MLEWADPPWGAGHWVPEQVAAAGAVDVFGVAGSDSTRLDWNDIAEADPDYIFSISCGFDLDKNVSLARSLYSHPVASGLRALVDGKLWALDANSHFSRPASRVVRGAELLRGVFAGEGDIAGERTRVAAQD